MSDYLQQILSGQQQKELTGQGKLTSSQIQAAFEGDIAARYQASDQARRTSLAEKTQSDTVAYQQQVLKGQTEAEKTNAALSAAGLGLYAYKSGLFGGGAGAGTSGTSLAYGMDAAANAAPGYAATANGGTALVYGSPAYDAAAGEVAGYGTATSGAAYGGSGVALGGAEAGPAVGAEAGASLGGAASAGMSAVPWAAAGYLAAKFGGQLLTNVAGEDTTFGKIGKTISDPLTSPSKAVNKEFLGDNSTINTLEDVFNPIGYAFKSAGISGTWICTAIEEISPFSLKETEALSRLRRYVIKNHREDAEAYLQRGKIITETIAPKDIMTEKKTISDICLLVEAGNMPAAYEGYKEMVTRMCVANNIDILSMYNKEVS